MNIYGFYHGLALYADILPLAIARGKIFGIKGQPVVKSVYIQAPVNYFLNKHETVLLSNQKARKRYTSILLELHTNDTSDFVRNQHHLNKCKVWNHN